MRADKFHEGYLPTEVEGGHQTVIPSGDLKPDALAVQDLGARSRFLDLVRRGPMRGPDKFAPTFKRNLCFRVISPKTEERIPSNYSHGMI